jgi:hypothetical protein
MQARLTTKPAHEVISAIQALDLESVKIRLMDSGVGEGWTQDHVDRIETEYKQFLTMVVKYQDDAEDILLSEDVDEFWHAHILHTIKYTEDCERVFGKYLHHNPQVVGQSSSDVERRGALAEKTRRLYQQEFGGRQEDYMPVPGFSGNSWKSAVCNVAIQAQRPAVCNVAIQAERSAVCNVAIQAERSAVCNVAVRAERPAVCNVAVKAERSAVCNVAIQAERSAVCNVAVRAERPAVCNVAVKAERPAVCNVAIQAERSAVCNVTIRAERVAVCNVAAGMNKLPKTTPMAAVA